MSLDAQVLNKQSQTFSHLIRRSTLKSPKGCDLSLHVEVRLASIWLVRMIISAKRVRMN